jgi:hypothetical protein
MQGKEITHLQSGLYVRTENSRRQKAETIGGI